MEEKLKIFFCEDDENLGMLLREYLQAKGYVTDLFSDGEAGYKGFTKGKYDLCVLDVMMPKKDGFTLAQEIRSINPDIPVIFLTAKTMKEDILEGFKIGAFYFKSAGKSTSYNCTDCSVHSRSVTAAGKDTNGLNFVFCHNNLLHLMNRRELCLHFQWKHPRFSIHIFSISL